ncbi:Lrp/AsnC family transcriptional regulator [Rhizomicrobium electricum]|jgi:DNA-binding Lrp family transcriptional regulator|uniref:Lrp/AsnC family transcriptional regulator n=1 Tax=Rhizomicrobium electricum TaxID=480070 RepID=A0ABN1EFA8_9PROT|nr:Lrp/AsnC family transcriptional regulator [Rhizomicrobium electricum]NIJ48600.1 DNA-binding Lrp family transcriptional regulator [Rhizomicrobium electricum]
MDDTDRHLVSLLRDNARLPVATLAKKLGVSRGTVQNRIARLIATGGIEGFTVRAKPDAGTIRAIMLIEIEGERSDRIVEELKKFPEVRAVHTTNGRWDMVIELATDSLQTFDRVLHRIRLIAGVSASETSLLLSSYLF